MIICYITYSYDALGRLTGETMVDYRTTVQNKTYEYDTYDYREVTYQTNRLKKIDDTTLANIDSTSAYNTNGYVSGISYNGLNATYTYDAVGRLTAETSGNRTFTYAYDTNNNIVSKTKNGTTINYTYDSQGRLTRFGSDTFAYDNLGNPTKYKDNTFNWTQGRKLASGTLNGNSFQYSYDGNGMRYKKVADGETTEYYYSGTQLLAEYNKNTWEMKYYFYDQTGVAGMIYEGRFGGIRYYYFDKNTLGDVIAIRDDSGEVVAEYFYDAWGNILEERDPYNSGIASANPFRYRGYYYDSETGFYYLQTRYYDPEIGRFINADDYELVGTLASVPGQLNMYAYCGNNPVMGYDPYGTWDWATFWQGIGMIVTSITAIALAVTTFGAATPLAMSIVAGVTLGAGALTGINGVATVIEAGTNYNFVEDGIFQGNSTAYNWYSGVIEGITVVGTITCGFWRAFNPIKGFTNHGLQSALSHDRHGVNASAMQNAVRNPLRIVSQKNGANKFIGKNAVVVLNKFGKVITTYATNHFGWRFL